MSHFLGIFWDFFEQRILIKSWKNSARIAGSNQWDLSAGIDPLEIDRKGANRNGYSSPGSFRIPIRFRDWTLLRCRTFTIVQDPMKCLTLSRQHFSNVSKLNSIQKLMQLSWWFGKKIVSIETRPLTNDDWRQLKLFPRWIIQPKN